MIDAGSINEIPLGKTKRVALGQGQRILICNVHGELFAVDDRCTHEDSSLYLGCLKGEIIHCSLHGGQFNVKTGAAVAEPAEGKLKTYRLTIKDQRIYIDLEA
ncbi:non-heme iron oxygenase ferredoxin subunit [uncultured Thiothrix sp.]|uniref:non-heme iron oxygenase ferredoxin subunit n=1 Tax=uncultured Thiothrix sp. TaxID=223185 RepID=UPI00262EE02B|nr:non-heme iron oxygenase ferredoxin subunit [uncultured Thiothrix sp.]